MYKKVSKRLFNIHEIIDFSFIIGALLGVCGTYWDIRYHIDVGRDSFWIPPHLMVYGGIAIGFLGSVTAFWSARKIHKPFSKKLVFAILLIILGGILQISGGPVDDWWHRIFGLDVTVWSPPHFLLIFSGFLISISVIYFQRLYMHIAKLDLVKKLTTDEVKLEAMFAIALVGLNIILAEFEYFRTIPAYHSSQLRAPWLYLSVLDIQFIFILVIAKVLISQKWTATRIALFYFITRSVLTAVLFWGRSYPILPPMIIVPAILLDLMMYRRVGLRKILVASGVFSISFYISQSAYLYFLDIKRYLPSNIPEVVGATVAAISFASLAYFIGVKMRTAINKIPA